MEEDENRWRMVLHATAAENEAQEFRRGMIDECEWMGQLGLYEREANTNDAGDLKWNVLAKMDRAMEWMRRSLAEKQAKEVYKVRWRTAWVLSSKAGRVMERHYEGQRMARRAGEHLENCGGGDDSKRQRGELQHHPNYASLGEQIHRARRDVHLH
jgi:hypothetical protein